MARRHRQRRAATGKLARVTRGELGKPDQMQQLACARSAGGAIKPQDLGRQQHVLQGGAPLHQRRHLEYEPDLALRSLYRSAIDANCAARSPRQSRYYPQYGRLAAAARPKHGHEFPRLDPEAHAGESMNIRIRRGIGLAKIGDLDGGNLPHNALAPEVSGSEGRCQGMSMRSAISISR